MNIAECRNALMKLTPTTLDERAKAREGFEETLYYLKEDLKMSLSTLAVIQEKDINAINKVSRKAATMWLSFGMQRCRILITPEGNSLRSDDEKIARMKKKTLRLVVVPRLSRIGNAEGLDLNGPEETVGGYKGEWYPKAS